MTPAEIKVEPAKPRTDASARERPQQVVVGLGNPGARYLGTPHNVGHDALDRLASRLQATWQEHPRAHLSRQRWKGCDLCLVKLRAPMNASGAAIRDLAAELGFEPQDLILVHDDLDLPLGTVRTRLRGSAGGHRGIASVLDALQTDDVRRVKLGIGRPDRTTPAADYVLQPFPDEDRPAVEALCATAEQRILDLVLQSCRSEAVP